MGIRSSLVIASLLVGCAAPTPESENVESTEDGLAANANVDIRMMIEEVEAGPTTLGVDARAFTAGSVSFFDTGTLALHAKGVTLRAQPGATTATLSPLRATNVKSAYAGLPTLACGYAKKANAQAVPSCVMAKEKDDYRIQRVTRGVDTPNEIFSPDQLAFVSAHATAVDWSKVKELGPIPSQTWKVQTRAIPSDDITLERWTVPGGARSLEISVKVKGNKAHEAETALKAWVTSLGLHAKTSSATADALATLTAAN